MLLQNHLHLTHPWNEVGMAYQSIFASKTTGSDIANIWTMNTPLDKTDQQPKIIYHISTVLFSSMDLGVPSLKPSDNSLSQVEALLSIHGFLKGSRKYIDTMLKYSADGNSSRYSD